MSPGGVGNKTLQSAEPRGLDLCRVWPLSTQSSKCPCWRPGFRICWVTWTILLKLIALGFIFVCFTFW